MLRKKFATRTGFLGTGLIVLGLLFNKPLLEAILVPDGQIRLPLYVGLIVLIQVVAIAAGIFLILKQPAIKLPSKAEVTLLIASALVTALVLEFGARFWLNNLATSDQFDRFALFTEVDPATFAWTPHPYLAYSPTPNYQNGQTVHNSLGYRGREFPMQKPEGTFRIVALGGSSTYDVRIEDNDKTFTAQLEKLLREDYGYEKVEVINAGVPGYNSWEILVNLEFRVLDLAPDLVIIYEGTNDVHARLVEPLTYRGDDTGRRQAWKVPPVALWEHSALLRMLSRIGNFTRQVSIDDFVSSPSYMSWPFDNRLTEAGLDPVQVLEQNPPIYFRRNLENMAAVARAHGVSILFSTWASSPFLNDYAAEDYYQAAFRENNQVVIEAANDLGVSVYDFAAVMPQAAEYWADGRHVNEVGALEKARLFASFIDAQALIDR